MALKDVMIYFYEALYNGIRFVGVCLCLLCNKGS